MTTFSSSLLMISRSLACKGQSRYRSLFATALLVGLFSAPVCATAMAGIFSPATITVGAAYASFSDLSLQSAHPLIQVSANADAKVEGGKLFIEDVSRRGLEFLADDDISRRESIESFEQLLEDSFDINIIARFVLGKYWHQASESQRAEYLDLFRKMIVSIYSSRFNEYSGQKLIVTGGRPEGKNDIIVSSDIISPNGSPPVVVKWRVRSRGDDYKIVDVIIEGVSMLVTQRSDFAAVIQRGGGDIEALLDQMRIRVAQAGAGGSETP